MADTKVNFNEACSKAFGAEYHGAPSGTIGAGTGGGGGKPEGYNPDGTKAPVPSNNPPPTHGRKGDGRK